MRITIDNLGPIDTISFDLSKDFHLIYGKNSIGKSYATYCLYCLIKNITKKRYPNSYNYQRNEDYDGFREKVIACLKQIKQKKSKPIILNEMVADYISQQLSQILIPGIENSLRNTFSSLQNLKNGYTKRPYSFTFHMGTAGDYTIASDTKGRPYAEVTGVSNDWDFVEKSTKTTKYSLYDGPKIVFGRATEDAFVEAFHEYVVNHLNRLLEILDSNVNDIYYLPASRSGLYQALNSFTPILAELTQNRFFINSKKIELPSLSEPLSDYFIDISTINNSNQNNQYKKLIEDIEKNILEGSIRYDDQTKKIKFKPLHLNFELDISEVSSMISEISPIVIYLKHILHHKFSSRTFYDYNYYRSRSTAERFDIIFIEEPEAHLHPEVQVKLMEVFAALTKHNIKIIMTSHSNFMFNKVNNMIISKELAFENIAVYHLTKTQSGSSVNPNMSVTAEGIFDENFAEVSKKLYEERINSLED